MCLDMRLVFREQLVVRHIFVYVANVYSSNTRWNEKQREKYENVFAKCAFSEPWVFFSFLFSLVY